MSLTKINTIADGNCLIHAILQLAYKDYQDNSEVEYRKKLVRKFREMLAESILESDPEYSTKESVAELVKKQFNVTTPFGFREFLRSMYKFESNSISAPETLREYCMDGKCYEKEMYMEYLEEYENYILHDTDKPTCLKGPRRESENELEDDTREKIVFLKNKFKEKELENNKKVMEFKTYLENKLDVELYMPNKFNKGVIEAIIDDEEIPDGLYSEYAFNCKLFTFCNGGNLMKIEYEYENSGDVLYLKNVSRYFNSNHFIGDADVLPFLPDMLELNIAIVNLDEDEVLNIYETTKNDKYVILHNIDNVHFEAVGLDIEESSLKTVHRRDDPVIQKLKTRKS